MKHLSICRCFWWANTIAHWVKYFMYKPNDLSSSPRTYSGRREPIPASCSVTSIHVPFNLMKSQRIKFKTALKRHLWVIS